MHHLRLVSGWIIFNSIEYMGGTQQSGFGSWRQCAADLLQQLTSVPTPCSSASLSELLGTLRMVNMHMQVHIAYCLLHIAKVSQCSAAVPHWVSFSEHYAASAHWIVNMQMQVHIAYCKRVPTPCSSSSLSEFLGTLLALSAHCIINMQMQVHSA